MDKSAVETEKSAGEAIVDEVRDRYGRIAKGKALSVFEQPGGCCSPAPKAAPATFSCCGGSESVSVKVGYDSQALAAVPEGADLGLGCGAPVEKLELRAGETALDLGSGAGIDVFLAARAVGPRGRVIGVDMTPEMLERARANAAKGGYANVEFREGRLERLPVEDASVDAVTSNCVINLVPDKTAVFREIARVLRPGGRLVISDIVLDGPLPESIEKDVYAYVGCIAGAAQRGDYFARLAAAGLGEVEILKDFDSLDVWMQAAPEEAQALLDRTGIRREDVAGKVRSITFRARRPA